MGKRFFGMLSAFLFVVILVLAWLLFTTPAHAPAVPQEATSTPADSKQQAPASEPLSSSVRVSSPAAGATVGQTFAISGAAPNGWYFEAVFPIMVRDADDNVLAHAQGRAQSDWMISGPVHFTATVTLERIYHGAATLILLKDNPSGLPQNDDSVEVPIVIQ